MKFYLDFEATRFSNRIISIGCVAENGKTFQTLVKPVNKAKVDKFITELTGITNEMLATAPEADEVFNQLFDFIELNSDSTVPEFYVYGNSDADFLKHTINYMKDTRAIICAKAIQGTVIDYAKTVKQFFGAGSDLALRKVYMLIKSQSELIQKHDALEDALMLKTIAENLHKKCKPEDKDTLSSIPSQRRPKTNKAPEIFVSWNAYSKWDAPTMEDGTWAIKAIDQHSKKEKYFKDIDTAILWTIKFCANRLSPKKEDNLNRVRKAIMDGSTSKKCKYNCFWEINEN